MAGYQGELAALGAAFLWAGAALLFEQIGRRVHSLEINLLKGTIAAFLLGITLLVTGSLHWDLPLPALLLLIASGALGIGVGDTAYFETLQCLGVRRSLLLGILAPPIAAILGLVFLGETLSLTAWLGVLVTVLGVAWVITEQTPAEAGRACALHRGVVFGLAFAFCQAGGAVLSRLVFNQTSVSPLATAFIRLVAGIAILVLWLALRRQKVLTWTRGPGAGRVAILVLVVSMFGTYFAIWLQQVSFKFTDVAVAQTLLSTSPLFGLLIAALRGEKPSLRAVLGALVAMAGVSLLFGLI